MEKEKQQPYVDEQAIFNAIRGFVSINNRKPSIVILNPTDRHLFVERVKREVLNFNPKKPYTFMNIEIIGSDDLKLLEIRVY